MHFVNFRIFEFFMNNIRDLITMNYCLVLNRLKKRCSEQEFTVWTSRTLNGGWDPARNRTYKRPWRASTFPSWTLEAGAAVQYASSVWAHPVDAVSSETHVALYIRLSIRASTRHPDDKNRIIEFSMSLAAVASVVATAREPVTCRKTKKMHGDLFRSDDRRQSATCLLRFAYIFPVDLNLGRCSSFFVCMAAEIPIKWRHGTGRVALPRDTISFRPVKRKSTQGVR